ncbi:MAG: ACP S-malonyltransferase [Candidatus Methylacidiphilales bacterium]
MKSTALLFAGQGAQHVGMGKDLVEAYPEAKALFAQADAVLGPEFSEVCFSGPESTLTETRFCQPALYVHGLALLAIVKKERPDFRFAAAAGLSLGEFTAHAAAGTFSFEDGLKLVAARGAFMQEACEATAGGMVTLLGATEEQARQVADQSGLEVANINCPGQIVLSGAEAQIPAAVAAGQALGLRRVIPLKVAGAYHSRLMASAQTKLEPLLAAAPMQLPRVPVFGNVEAAPAEDLDGLRSSLVRQVTGTVRWQASIEAMRAFGIERFIELGPGKVLAGLLKRIDQEVACLSIGNLHDLKALIHELD